jgi:hypothetical protein
MDVKTVQILDAPPALPSRAHWYRGQEQIFHAYQRKRLESACGAPRPQWPIGVERGESAYCASCCTWANTAGEFHGSAPQGQEDAVVLPVPPPLPDGVHWRAPLAAVGTGSNGQPVALEPTFHAVPEVRADGIHKDALCGQPRPRYPHRNATRLPAVKRQYCTVCLRFSDITVPTHLRDESDPFCRYPQVLHSEQPNEFSSERQFNEMLMRSSRIHPDKYGMPSAQGRWAPSRLEAQMQVFGTVSEHNRYLEEQARQMLNTPLIPLGFPWPLKSCLEPLEDQIPRPWLALLLKEPRPAGHVQSWYRREEDGREVFYGRPKDPAMRHVRVTPEQIAYAVRDDASHDFDSWRRLRDIIQTAFFEHHPNNPPAKKPSKKAENFFWSPEDQADTIARDQ